MITETGRVIALHEDRAWVQTISQSACNACSARQGCGQKVLASVSSGRANQILVDNHVNARVGDEVTVAIEESALLRASLLVYALPLLLMVTGAILGQWLAPGSDALAMLLAATGLGVGFFSANRIQKHGGEGVKPRLQGIVRPAEAAPDPDPILSGPDR